MANKRLNATIAIGGTVDRSLTRGLTNTKGQIAQVGSAISKAEQQQRDLSRQIQTFGRQGRSVDGLRARYADLSSEIDRLRRRQEALNRIASADVGGKFSNMTTEVGRFTRRAAMAGTVTAGAIFGIANSTSELGDNVAKTADKLGMGIAELQAYRYAAERSGVASQTFDMATQRMVRRVAEAAQGTGEAKDAIAELGLSAEALASMTPDEQMNHFADALQNVENQGDRVRLAMKLFDSEGVALVNMLKDGSAGLRQYAEDARRTGYILSDEAARDAEKFQDTLLNTKLSLFGLKNIIGSALMPVVSDMMGKFTGWLAENREQVRSWSATFTTRLQAAVPVIMELASGIGTVIGKIGNAVSVTADLVGGFDNLGMVIGTLFAGKAILSVVAFGGAIVKVGAALLSLTGAIPLVVGGIKAIGMALMANPVGLIIGAIAGAAYLIYRNWDGLSGWFGNLWNGVKETFAAASDYVVGKLKAAWEGVKTVLAWSPLGLIVRAWSGLGDRVGSMAELAKAGLDVAWAAIKTVLSWSPLALITASWAPMANVVGNVVGIAKDMVSATWDWMSAKLSWSPLEVITGAWGGVSGWFGNMWDGITETAAAAMDWITGKLEWVGSAFNKVKGWLSFGGDDDTDDVRERLGGGNAGALNLGSSQQEAAARGQEMLERGPARPQLSGGGSASEPAERPREITQTITNHLELHVERAGGEDEASYAQRIASLVMDELNQRQQGALYDA